MSSEEEEQIVAPEATAARNRDKKLQKFVDDFNSKKRPAPLIDSHTTAKKVGHAMLLL